MKWFRFGNTNVAPTLALKEYSVNNDGPVYLKVVGSNLGEKKPGLFHRLLVKLGFLNDTYTSFEVLDNRLESTQSTASGLSCLTVPLKRISALETKNVMNVTFLRWAIILMFLAAIGLIVGIGYKEEMGVCALFLGVASLIFSFILLYCYKKSLFLRVSFITDIYDRHEIIFSFVSSKQKIITRDMVTEMCSVITNRLNACAF